MSHAFATGAAVLALAVTASTAMAEDSYLDLRVGGGYLARDFKGPSSTTVSTNGSTPTYTESGGDSKADGNTRGQVELMYGHLYEYGGPIVGVDAGVNWARFGHGNRITTPVADLIVGYGYQILPGWHFELAPFAGYGRSYYDISDSGNIRHHDSTRYIEYGARVGTYITLLRLFQVGVEVPYFVGRFKEDVSHASGSSSYTSSDSFRNQGFGVLLSLGLRL
jgi:hypothetical protein